MKEYSVPEEVKETVLKALTGFNLYAVYLTGSRSYGFYDEDSDYDMLAFVVPSKQDLFLGKPMVSKVVKTNNPLVEQVVVRDVRFLLNYLKKPTFNMLFLYQEPCLQFGKKLFDKGDAMDGLFYGRKNFLLSLGGVYTQRVKQGTTKDKAHALYLEQLFDFASQSSTLSGLKPEDCLAVRLGKKEYDFKEPNFLLEKAKKYSDNLDATNFHMLLDKKMFHWLEDYYKEC